MAKRGFSARGGADEMEPKHRTGRTNRAGLKLGFGAAILAAASSFACVFAGCGKAEEKEVVTVALWGDQLMENYAPWLQEQFPDVDFDFYSATNTTDYYNYLAENDQLPDILTVRRFSLKDVEGIRDELMDLSDTEVANSYYQSYLRSYTYSDGTVNWLPASAEIDDIIINKTLFEENNIAIPTDYESFVAACEAFEELGITGYVTDIFADYTCMETLQGFSAGILSSAEGLAWRQAYESGTTNQLSEEVWLPVFEKMLDVLTVTGMNEATLEERGGTIGAAFTEGSVAMFRGSVAYMELYGEQYEKIIIPYPGDTEDQSFYLTYPVFQAAAKKQDTTEREELIVEIMTAMMSEEGLNHIIPGESMVAYNKDAEMTLDDSISNLEPYIENNQMYIRLASSDMFSVSQTVVNEMLTGELTTAQEALDEFNRILKENETSAEEDTVAHIDTGYSRTFTEEHGNQAASALFNTMREETGVDCMIGQSACVGCDIMAGDYTEKTLGYLLNWESSDMREMNLTGNELKEYVEFWLTVQETRDSVVNQRTLPVTSGFEMVLSEDDDGYHVVKLTIDGEDIEDDRTYSVLSWDCFWSNYMDLLDNSDFTEYEVRKDIDADTLIRQRLVDEGGQLSAPTDYISFQ